MKITEIHSKKYRFASDTEKAEVKAKMDKLRKEEVEKTVKGIFEFVDAQGGWLDFTFRILPGSIQTIHITHGEVCEVPIILAKHLNNVYKKVRTIPDNLDSGKGYVTKISRCRFTPLSMT